MHLVELSAVIACSAQHLFPSSSNVNEYSSSLIVLQMALHSYLKVTEMFHLKFEHVLVEFSSYQLFDEQSLVVTWLNVLHSATGSF